MSELPTFKSNAYSDSVSNRVLTTTTSSDLIYKTPSVWEGTGEDRLGELMRRVQKADVKPVKEKKMSERRLVRVLIADPNLSVPVDSALLHDSKEFFTDLTDEELYFEIDVKGILEKHNQKRVTFRNKEVKDREESLEPARIRDLEMVVLTIAELG